MSELDDVFARINADLDKMNRDLDHIGRTLDGIGHNLSAAKVHVIAAAFVTLIGLIVAADIAMWLAS